MIQPDDDLTRTHVALVAGTMVSHDRVVEKIGVGGISEVYLAENTGLLSSDQVLQTLLRGSDRCCDVNSVG